MNRPSRMFDVSKNYWNHAKKVARITVAHVPCNNVATDTWNHALSLLEEDHHVNLKLLYLLFDSSLTVQQTNTCRGSSSLLIFRLLSIFQSRSIFSSYCQVLFLLLLGKTLTSFEIIHPLFDSSPVELRRYLFRGGSVTLKFNVCSYF